MLLFWIFFAIWFYVLTGAYIASKGISPLREMGVWENLTLLQVAFGFTMTALTWPRVFWVAYRDSRRTFKNE